METVSDAQLSARNYIDRAETLSDAEMRKLVQEVQSPNISKVSRQLAIDRLVRGCLRYARYVIRKSSLYDSSDPFGWGDIGVFTIGILDAANRFDLAQKTPFMTYAMFWIRCRCYERFRENATINTYKTRLGILISHKLVKLFRTESPDVSSIIATVATELNTSEERVWEVYVAKYGIVTSGCIYEECNHEDDLLEELTAAERVVRLQQVIDSLKLTLSPRHLAILNSRLLVEKEDARTLDDLGKEFGLTRERVRQLEQQIRAKISEAVKSDTLANGTY